MVFEKNLSNGFLLLRPGTVSRPGWVPTSLKYALIEEEPEETYNVKDGMHLVSRTDPTRTGHGVHDPAHLRRRGGSAQFSRDRPRTRSNSGTLFVTSVSPIARAWAAMNRSLAPIISPRFFRSARISA